MVKEIVKKKNNKIKLKKGDTVIVLSGKDRKKKGQILKVIPTERKIVVSGINEVKKHTKPSKTSQGGIIVKSLPMHVSKVAFFDEKANTASKIGFKILKDGEKKRFAKKSGEIIG